MKATNGSGEGKITIRSFAWVAAPTASDFPWQSGQQDNLTRRSILEGRALVGVPVPEGPAPPPT